MTQDSARDDSPYKGLRPYTEDDRKYFFGRDRDREIIISNLFASPLTIFYGASGVGKSSVLLAGVVPELKSTPRLAVVVFREWQDAGFESALRREVLRAVGESAKRDIEVDASLEFDEFLFACMRELRGSIFFVLDQFEEYFLYHPVSPQTEEFDAAFARAVNRQEVGANFLLSMRDDGLSKLDRFQRRIPNLLNNMLRLEHLNRSSASEAIRKPLEKYNSLHTDGRPRAGVEDELVQVLLEDLGAGKVTLDLTGQGKVEASPGVGRPARIETPFLQVVLSRLWDEEGDAADRPDPGERKLRLETYKRLGGATTIVRTHLDKMMKDTRLAPHRDVAAALFHFLVTPGGQKIAHTPADLASYAGRSPEEVETVLNALSHPEVRILLPIAAPPDQPGATRYEIFHDVLAPAILDWRSRHMQQVTEAEAERTRIAAEKKAQDERARAEREAASARRLRWVTAVLALVTLLALGSTAYAYMMRREAARNLTDAREARSQAQAAQQDAAANRESAEARGRIAIEAQKRATDALAEAEKERKNAEARKAEADIAEARALEAVRKAEIERGEKQKQEARAVRAARKLEAEQLAAQLKTSMDTSDRPDYDEIVRKYEHAIKLFEIIGEPQRQAEVSAEAAEVYLKISDRIGAEFADDPPQTEGEDVKFDNLAVEYLKRARQLYSQIERNGHSKEAETLEALANIYVRRQDADTAAAYLEQAASLYDERNEDELQSKITLLTTAARFFQETDRRRALDYLLKVLPLERMQNQQEDERPPTITKDGANARTLRIAGTLYNHMGETQTALDYYRRATSTGDARARVLALINLGNANSAAGDKREALRNYAEALLIHEEGRASDNPAYALLASGDASYELGDKQAASDYYKRAIEEYANLLRIEPSRDLVWRYFYLNELLRGHEALARVYDDLGDGQNAADARNRSSALRGELGTLPESVKTRATDTVRTHTERAIGRVYDNFGDVKRASEFYRKWKEKYPGT